MKKTITQSVFRKAGMLLLCVMSFGSSVFAQKVTVSGKVTSADDHKPLVGVSVITATGGGITDQNGRYNVTTDMNGTLTFSYLGYTDVTEKVAGRTNIDVAMKTDSKTIEEVVVLGYTTQKKAEISSSIVSLSGEVLNDVTSPDVGNMLQGKAAGVVVMNASGQPGEAAQIRIRGTGSLTAGADPLYVVDGVAGGSFNPNDVETITILKDASATALYGASASGGVIVVTTKNPSSDKPVVNFKLTGGIKKALNGRFSAMNSQELYDTQKLMYSPALFKIQRPSTLLDTDFNWTDACFKIGAVQDYYASVSGKANGINYFLSIDHYDEVGSLINTNFDRNSARLNLGTKLSDKVDLNVRLSYNRNNEQGESSYTTLECAYRALPWDSPYDVNTGEVLYVDSAKRSDNGKAWYSHDKYNILHNELYNYSKSTYEEAVADIQLSWKITDWLLFTSTNRFNTANSFTEQYIDPRTKSPSYSNGYIYNYSGFSKGWGTTDLLKASKDFGEHSVSGVIGWEYGDGFSRNHWGEGTDMPNGQASLSNSVKLSVGGYNYKSRSYAGFGQAQYSYAGKYIATASLRYDAQSKFAIKGGWFPGISGAWIVSKEDFLSGVDAVDFLKVRAGYGKTGNDNIENFLYQDTYKLSAQYQDVVAAILERQKNPNLTWEEAYMASFGIEGTVFGHINFGFDLYNTVNKKLLLAVPQATSTGFFEFMDNVGSVRNRGIEFHIDGNIMKSQNFTWNMGFNIGFNKNTVTELPNGEFLQSTSSGLKQQVKVGQDIYSWYMPKWLGVDPATGDPQWEIVNEDGTKTATNQFSLATPQVVGTASPKFTGGINAALRYKNWTLNMNGSFVYGNKVFNYTRTVMDSDGAYSDYNMMSIDNGLGWSRWSEAGDIATHPKPVLNGNKSSNSISSRYLEDGSFFRLKNITLGYDIPQSFAQKIKMQGGRIYISCDNILTLTRFSGMDPEVRLETSSYYLAGTYSNNYPVPLSVVLGIDVKF